MRATWKPHEKHGELTGRKDLPDSVFAYPKERKEPMTDASHVRNAIARFDQVDGVSNEEREQAFANIKKASKHYGVKVSESEWSQLGGSTRKGAQTRKPKGSDHKETAARKSAATRAATTRKKSVTRKKTATRKKVVRKKSSAHE